MGDTGSPKTTVSRLPEEEGENGRQAETRAFEDTGVLCHSIKENSVLACLLRFIVQSHLSSHKP